MRDHPPRPLAHAAHRPCGCQRPGRAPALVGVLLSLAAALFHSPAALAQAPPPQNYNYTYTPQAPPPQPYPPAISGIDRSVMGLEMTAQEQNYNGLLPSLQATETLLDHLSSVASKRSKPTLRQEEKRQLDEQLESLLAHINALTRVVLYGTNLSFGVRTGSRDGHAFNLPEVLFGFAPAGVDVGLQDFLRGGSGLGWSVKYAPGKSREHYSSALVRAHGLPTVAPGSIQEFSKFINGLIKAEKVDVNTLDNARLRLATERGVLLGTLDLTLVPAAAPAVNPTRDGNAPAGTSRTGAGETDSTTPELFQKLERAAVSYSAGLQTSVYVTGRHYDGLGDFMTAGVSLGIRPFERVGLLPSAVLQAVRYRDPAPGGSYGLAGQAGVVLALQDAVNGYTVDGYTMVDGKPVPKKVPQIRPWHIRVGGEYYGPTFGRHASLRESYDFFLRIRLLSRKSSHADSTTASAHPGHDEASGEAGEYDNAQTYDPTYLEVVPFWGKGGPGHREFSGVDISITTPLKH